MPSQSREPDHISNRWTLTSSVVYFHFQVCVKKRSKREHKIRASTDNVVTEVQLPTDDADTSYNDFLRRSEGRIQQVIEDNRQLYGYLVDFFRLAICLQCFDDVVWAACKTE